MFSHEKKVYITVLAQEMRLIRSCLMRWRNALIAEGHITDPIDEMLVRLYSIWDEKDERAPIDDLSFYNAIFTLIRQKILGWWKK